MALSFVSKTDDVIKSPRARPLLGATKRSVSLDLDGIPLRDPSTRIDPRSLLSKAPVIEEEDPPVESKNDQTNDIVSCLPQEDDEYEFIVDDDDDCRVQKLKRHSSLKVQRSDCAAEFIGLRPDEPERKKSVQFADALGLGLEDFHDLINPDEPPEVPPAAFRDLRIRRKRSKTDGQYNLALEFEQPGCQPDFIMTLLAQKVALENCLVSDRDMTLSGLVRVVNVTHDKSVTIRYTPDSWLTFYDIIASGVPNSSDGTSERFTFVIHLPSDFGVVEARLGNSRRVEFAVSYTAGNTVHWDNNGGKNYTVYCKLCDVKGN